MSKIYDYVVNTRKEYFFCPKCGTKLIFEMIEDNENSTKEVLVKLIVFDDMK